MKRRWLKDWPWETVVAINAGLCKEKSALHKPTSDGYKPAEKLWESSRKRELTLRETLDLCRRCRKPLLSAFIMGTRSWRLVVRLSKACSAKCRR